MQTKPVTVRLKTRKLFKTVRIAARLERKPIRKFVRESLMHAATEVLRHYPEFKDLLDIELRYRMD